MRVEEGGEESADGEGTGMSDKHNGEYQHDMTWDIPYSTAKDTKHIVGFSGGIDSQACAGVVIDTYGPDDVILVNSDAGANEHPLTTEFVRWYSANVHPVVEVHAIVADIWQTPDFAETKGLNSSDLLDFGRMSELKGRFPSRKAQFCTEILKLKPLKRWLTTAFGPTGIYAGHDYIRYAGVRRSESEARANAELEKWDEYYDCVLRHPIVYWAKQSCFDYCLKRDGQINPLYTMGFNRVGCAPCINSSKTDILNWATRFPEMIDKVRRWEKQNGRQFFPPNIVPGVQIADVDRVVEWSKTTHGGKELKVLEEPKNCESKYGLCE